MNMFVKQGRPAGDSSDEEEIDGFIVSGPVQYNKKRQEAEALENYKKEHRYNDLVHAVTSGHVNFVKEYFDSNDIDINAPIRYNENTLYIAASHARYPVVLEMLRRKADANAVADGKTVLMAACETRREELISFVEPIVIALLQSGADTYCVDSDNRTALMLACAQGIPAAVKFLLPRSQLEAEDRHGWTALFYAVTANRLEIAILLLRRNANVYHTDIDNYTVLDYANQYDLNLMMQFLQDFTDEPDPDEPISLNDQQCYYDIKEQFRKTTWEFLRSLKCDNLISILEKNNIDFVKLFSITKEELIKAGVRSRNHRMNIVRAVYEFQARPFKSSSLPIYVNEPIFTSDHVLATIANSIKNLTIIYSSILYLKKKRVIEKGKRLQLDPVLLESCLVKIKNIMYVVTVIHNQAIKHDEKKPADWIASKAQARQNKNYFKYVVAGAACASIYLLRKYFK